MLPSVYPAKAGLEWTRMELSFYKVAINTTQFLENPTGTEPNVDLSHLDSAFLNYTPFVTATRTRIADTDTASPPAAGLVSGGTVGASPAASGTGVSTSVASSAVAGNSHVALDDSTGDGEISTPAIYTVPSMDEFSDQTFYLLKFLHLASFGNFGQEFAIEDFARQLLCMLGFQSRIALLRTRYPIPLLASGQSLTTPADISLVGIKAPLVLLVLQKANPISLEPADPEPQLVAAAISAFYANRRALRGKAQPEEMIIPGIVMEGSRPTFYLIPVTTALSDAVAMGVRPESETRVSKCVVPWPKPKYGMELPAFRVKALRYFLAFKALTESLSRQYQGP